jgi:addiction module HigA family antidote
LKSNENVQPEYLVDRSARTRPPTHPGVLFGEDVLPELRKAHSLGEIAALLGVSRQTLYRIAAGDVAISPEMAVRLGKLCGNGPGLWIRMQGRYDTWEASRRLARELKKIPTLA